MNAYYSENDPFAAAWLRELVKAKQIPDGEVDERSIADVRADDLRGFQQCHFFAGIGGWAYALRLAGWPDEREVWTGSCPCQPFSSAGAQTGGDDPRDLWPIWFKLIKECRPVVVFGEQVEAAIGHGWLDRLCDDLEAEGYAVGAVGLPGPCVGAFDIRQRLWFVADTGYREGRRGDSDVSRVETATRETHNDTPLDGRRAGRVADTPGERQTLERLLLRPEEGRRDAREVPQATGSGEADELGDTDHTRSQGRQLPAERAGECATRSSGVAGGLANANKRDTTQERTGNQEQREQRTPERWRTEQPAGVGTAGRTCGGHHPRGTDRRGDDDNASASRNFWANCEWIPCADGKTRPVEPKYVKVADGLSGTMVSVRHRSNEAEAQEAIDVETAQAHTVSEVPPMSGDVTQEAIRVWDARGFIGVQTSTFLRSDVYGGLDGGPDESAFSEEQPPSVGQDGEADMRAVRSSRTAICASSGREPDEQQPLELTDFVRLLPSSLAFAELHGDCATAEALRAVLKASGAERLVQYPPYQVEAVWRSLSQEAQNRFWLEVRQGGFMRTNESPLSIGAPARVGRLRGYGNAIKPEVAQVFIEAYLETQAHA